MFNCKFQIPGLDDRQVPYAKRMVAKYKRAWRMWVGPVVPIVSLCHPETVKVLAKSEEPKFTEATTGYVLGKPWIGNDSNGKMNVLLKQMNNLQIASLGKKNATLSIYNIIVNQRSRNK